ncbi:MAG: SAM-dependent methyltransferase [Synechococcaceae cyanobacterium]|nr:SAM-dependent methyltransferase [Synechococcaceae cyanobacterium]
MSPAVLRSAPSAPPAPQACPATDLNWSERVQRGFQRQAGSYEAHARMQRAVAWRLAHLCRHLPLASGPRADLGAGTGLLSRALLSQHDNLRDQPPLQLDLCAALLARNRCGPKLLWNLETPLPEVLDGSALLMSSFALQWLSQPEQRLADWVERLAPTGWLALAVPTSGSFPQWRQAACSAAVPCTALELPTAERLQAAASAAGLRLHHARVMRFSRAAHGGRTTLRLLARLGATASRGSGLGPGRLRRLLAHWPEATPLTWEVLLLLGRRP